MKNNNSDIPIVFIFFNRIDTTIKAFEGIVNTKPKILVLSSDGPRHTEEQLIINNLRRTMLQKIDWDCKIIKYFYKENLGTSRHVVTTLSKVFKIYDKAIYIEDDIITTEQFFKYMYKMLYHFEDDDRILGINGSNMGAIFRNDLVLLHHPIVWGFGIYKRLWNLYDFELKEWRYERRLMKDKFINNKVFYYYDTYFTNISHKKNFTWALQLAYIAYKYDKLYVTPKYNLCTNIGFENGTSPFLYEYTTPIEEGTIKVVRNLHYDVNDEKVFYKTLLHGGWLRLLSIRTYMYLPKKIQQFIKLTIQYFKKII